MASLTGRISARASMTSTLSIGYSSVPYSGEYTFTPSAERQVIDIAGKTAAQNLVIDPIPSNYGKITWNGSVITVS